METMAERRNRQYAEAVAAKKAAAGISDTVEAAPQPIKTASPKPAASEWGLLGGALSGITKRKRDIEKAVKESEE